MRNHLACSIALSLVAACAPRSGASPNRDAGADEPAPDSGSDMPSPDSGPDLPDTDSGSDEPVADSGADDPADSGAPDDPPEVDPNLTCIPLDEVLWEQTGHSADGQVSYVL